MTLSEDARRLAEHRPRLGGTRLSTTPNGACYYCGENRGDEPHTPACWWNAMPRIVAALEAAEKLVSMYGVPEGAYAEVHYTALDALEALLRSE